MELLTRPLGTSGMQITQVGFGAWAIGGGDWAYGWGSQDDTDSVAAIKHAIASGINWVDTAAVYGLGHSEEVVGRALREILAADRPFVFTKGGQVGDPTRPFAEPQHNLRPESIRKEIEASLRRLGVERIDLYQFHWPDNIGTPIEESWGEMANLIKEGKVRAGGVSNFDVGLLERAERVRHVDSLQPPFSLIHRQSGADVIPWSAAHGTGVIAYSPMQSGILTDAFSHARVDRMDGNDWRRRNPEFREPLLSRNLALRDALRPIASSRRFGLWRSEYSRVRARCRGSGCPPARPLRQCSCCPRTGRARSADLPSSSPRRVAGWCAPCLTSQRRCVKWQRHVSLSLAGGSPSQFTRSSGWLGFTQM